MLNRRNVLKNVFALPLLYPSNLKSRKSYLEKIVDDIEKNAIKTLSAKNQIIQSLKSVQIFEDESLHILGRSAFYGFVDVKLYPVDHNSYYVDYNIDMSRTGYRSIVELINDYRSAMYGFYHVLDSELNKEDTKKVLDILWKRAGYTEYKGRFLNA